MVARACGGGAVSAGRDLTGQTFGRLTVRERAPTPERKPHQATGPIHRHWLCDCVCGSVKVVPSTSLLGGRTRSCGCLQRERSAAWGAGLAALRWGKPRSVPELARR